MKSYDIILNFVTVVRKANEYFLIVFRQKKEWKWVDKKKKKDKIITSNWKAYKYVYFRSVTRCIFLFIIFWIKVSCSHMFFFWKSKIDIYLKFILFFKWAFFFRKLMNTFSLFLFKKGEWNSVDKQKNKYKVIT